MVYFSQLDLVRILERALRRTKLPLYFTQGYNPRVKVSFGRALKLGIEGEEEVAFYLLEKINPQEVAAKIKPQLPAGLDIISAS